MSPYARKTSAFAACILAGSTLLVGTATAQAESADGWRFQGTLYLYLPTIGGSTTFPQNGSGGATVDGSLILDNLQSAFMGAFEARKGAWGAFTDVIYLDSAGDKSGFRNFTIGGVGLPAGATADVRFGLTGWAWTLAGERRAFELERASLDVLAGLRVFDLEQTFGWQTSGNVGGIPLPGRSGNVKVGLTNVDAIIGAKWRVGLSKDGRWFMPYYVDIGTGDSDMTFQAMAGVGYSFAWGDVLASWRYVDYQMKSGQPVQSMTFNGPAVAVAFRW